MAKLVELLREDARYTMKELADMTGRKESEVRAEVAALERSGVIVKYTVLVDEEKLGNSDVEALIEVKVSPQHTKGFDALAEEIYAFDEVRTVYLMSGAYDLAVFVKGATLREVALFVSEKLSVMDNVISTATHFILKKYKMDGVVLDREDAKRLAVQA